MQEYLQLGHMEPVPLNDMAMKDSKVCYLPHHPVQKESSLTTKLRIVFDASCKSSSGTSLNDKLLVGPTIQPGLLSILLRFRKHNYVFASDIEKMYRQIRVAPEDINFQRIVWRADPTEPVKHYRLLTVTFGIASAPFLATRVLKQLSKENEESYPEAARIICNDFYVDDLMSGGDNLEECKRIQRRIIQILNSGGFQLQKWTSNATELLQDVSSQHRNPVEITEGLDTVKLLGLNWVPSTDCFKFKVNLPENFNTTKRQILSDSSRIFDPLGWLSPCTIVVKILFQQLWLKKLDWDDELPTEIAHTWKSLRSGFLQFERLNIPRQVVNTNSTIQIHGFCDASQNAYSAVIYARSMNSATSISVNIITAKTKVAPIKQISIPRLELCGAVLLARLMQSTIKELQLTDVDIFAWTDSTIVLAWLSSHPRRWKTFVGNRVSEILETLPRNYWNHVATQENPADCASRGLSSSVLPEFKLWWNGPEWLQHEQDTWPKQTLNDTNQTEVSEEERRAPTQALSAINSENIIDGLVERCSSLDKVIRILARCQRFIHNLKSSSDDIRRSRILSTDEYMHAKRTIIRQTQSKHFKDEILALSNLKGTPRGSKLVSLNPFLDSWQILRVGGRLEHSSSSYDCKHPIILPEKDKVTDLIVREFHSRYLHPGISTLMGILRQQFWIIRCKHLVRRHTLRCLQCFRQRRAITEQLMGNLPSPRVNCHRPFLHAGVDYAGPILLKTQRGRGGKTYKGYICLFVCLSTKAFHLETATDLSTEAFLAALKRFVSRRGLCTDMYSDNGSNFKGAKKCLSELHALVLSKQFNNIISQSLLKDNINWHLIPPTAPNFGGIWESGIKLVKHHLRRVIGNSVLTYEEMSTLLTQVEGILNSRPLCGPVNDEVDALTPAHFLIGHPITIIPEPSILDLNPLRLSKWQQIQQMTQGFWARWKTEYLTTLQKRSKWTTPKPNIGVNDVVVIADEHTPPSKWPLARVVAVHPGADGLVRVVTLKTSSGLYKRPISKICRLPCLEPEDSTRAAC